MLKEDDNKNKELVYIIIPEVNKKEEDFKLIFIKNNNIRASLNQFVKVNLSFQRFLSSSGVHLRLTVASNIQSK